jgi:uncharacterized protein DUF6266
MIYSLLKTKCMARYDKGACGQSGKVGPVVGTFDKGICYLRSNPRKTKNRDVSAKIEIPRAKFKLASNFVNAIASLLAIAFPDSKTKAASRSNALSNVLQQAVTGDYPDLRIDYSKVLMASGCLSPTVNPTATSTEPAIIKFTWKDSTGYGNAKATDKPILIAYCETLNACGFTVSDELRSAETASLPAQLFSGREAHTWISFLSENGKDVAVSSYTGALAVA